jgi:hypothetical protein
LSLLLTLAGQLQRRGALLLFEHLGRGLSRGGLGLAEARVALAEEGGEGLRIVSAGFGHGSASTTHPNGVVVLSSGVIPRSLVLLLHRPANPAIGRCRDLILVVLGEGAAGGEALPGGVEATGGVIARLPGCGRDAEGRVGERRRQGWLAVGRRSGRIVSRDELEEVAVDGIEALSQLSGAMGMVR